MERIIECGAASSGFSIYIFDGCECKSVNVLIFESYYRPGRDKGFSKSFDLISNQTNIIR